MTARKAFGKAWRLWKAHPLDTLSFAVVEVCLRGIALSPLLCLCDASVRWGAVLALPLWVLIVPVARQNAAANMRDAFRGAPLCTPALISTERYGAKLARGLKTGGWLLLCALLCLAASVGMYIIYTGDVDTFTVLRWIMNLGGGSLMQGIRITVIAYVCSFLPLLAGFAWHCGTRHAAAYGRGTKGKHGLYVRCWLLSLLPLLPFLVVSGWISASYVAALVKALSGIASGGVTLPTPTANLYGILGAALVLLLPAVPLKQMVPAASETEDAA